MDQATVYVKGTPIWYRVNRNNVGAPSSMYVSGRTVETCLGKLQCEEVFADEEGNPSVVVCSVPASKMGNVSSSSYSQNGLQEGLSSLFKRLFLGKRSL